MDDLDKIELTEEVKVILRERQTELVKITEALGRLENSKEWETLKELVFNRSLVGIERQLLNETLATKIDTDKLYRLQGEWAWAKQYNDTKKFADTLKQQLESIKQKLK